MKIALLHYSFWPEMGGVEQVMRDQAAMLRREGHEVKVVCGKGAHPGDDYPVDVVPELAPDFPLNTQVRAVLERGQADQNFSKYRSALVEALKKALEGVELTLVHNVFTMHHNLALTRALHDIAPHHRMVAWTHDLVATNTDYALPNPTQPPWNLMRTSCPNVVYVAASEFRAEEMRTHLKPEIAPQVVPNPVDPLRLFGLTAEMRESYASLDLPARDFVFLLPAAAMPSKNIDFALEVVKQLHAADRNPLVLITAPPVSGSAAAERYGSFLRQSLPTELAHHVVFVNDFFPVGDAALRDLYLLADCLIFPSRREGFGLPIVEAARFRLPVWCQDVPAYQALEESGAAFLLKDISQLGDAVGWLEQQSIFLQQRRCRELFDPGVVYRDYYEPLLAAFGAGVQRS